MGKSGMTRALAALAVGALLAVPLTAAAADLFLRGDVGISAARGAAGGFNTFVPFVNGGSDEDSSPVYGGALGVAIPLNAAIPLRLRIPACGVPYWPGREWRFGGSEDWRLPDWETRLEVEGLFGRDFELSTAGFTPEVPYRSEVSSWSVMGNLSLDVPIQAPINALFGRIPLLEPLSLFGGVGLGLANNKLSTSDSIVSGRGKSTQLAHQFMAGIGYALTERVRLNFGWRYVDLGNVDVSVTDLLASRGKFGLDLTAHELNTSLRVNFYHLPFLGDD